MKNILISIVMLIIMVPLAVTAQGIVPCEGPDCNFGDLFQLAHNIIGFLVLISIPLAAIAFAWAGFLYLFSAGDQGKIKTAHGIFLKVGIGLVIVLGAYLLVDVIMRGLTEDTVEGHLEDYF